MVKIHKIEIKLENYIFITNNYEYIYTFTRSKRNC